MTACFAITAAVNMSRTEEVRALHSDAPFAIDAAAMLFPSQYAMNIQTMRRLKLPNRRTRLHGYGLRSNVAAAE